MIDKFRTAEFMSWDYTLIMGSLREPFSYFMRFMILILGTFVGLLVIGMPISYIFLEGMMTTWLLFLCMTPGFIAIGYPFMSVYRGVPTDDSYYNGDTQLTTRVKEYYSLSSLDRERYPDDIISAVKNPKLTASQKRTLDELMKEIYTKIVENNKALEVDKTPDLDYLFAQMRTEIQYLDGEADIMNKMKELS